MASCRCNDLDECWSCYSRELFSDPAFRTLLITNIDPRLQPIDIALIFESFGPVTNVEIQPISWVGAQVGDFELGDAKLRVQYGVDEYAGIFSRELCITGLEMPRGGIPAMEETLKERFSRFGPVDFVTVPNERLPVGYLTIALVRFLHDESAKRACAGFDAVFPDDSKIKVQYSVNLKFLPDREDVREEELEESLRRMRARSATPCALSDGA